VAADDLNAPLGQTKKRSGKLPIGLPQAIAGALALFLVVFVLWALIADNPYGGEPMAVVSAATPAAKADAAKTDAAKRDAARKTAASPQSSDEAGKTGPNRYDGPGGTAPRTTAPGQPVIPPGAKTVTIIDGSSGKRQQVVLPGPHGTKLAALDQRISETTPHGLIPKIAADGARAADVFAQPVKALPGKPNAPRIAIVIGGLGISSALTAAALSELPGPVTFAVPPYGHDLDALVARMRGAGHEVLLQVPMEPFDYPDNDPGPQTLLTTLSAEQNADRLHWLMSRFQGYVGITNYMGARFTASDRAFAPVLHETAKRGLIYFDDGASPRSIAGQIAGANNLQFARAGVVIDAVPTPTQIDRALGRLETVARESGVAVGMAHALPASIAHIAKWAKAAAKRGLLLVPISAAANKAKSS
jgi:uncharacterized protein